MKKILFSLLISSATLGIAQQNLDLEAWTTKPSGSDSADYWFNPTDATAYGAPQNLFQETVSVAQGASAAKLETVYWAAGSLFGLDTLPGVILQQLPYTLLPTSLSFSYKSNPQPGDYNIVAAQLSHWDTVTNTQVIDAAAIFTTNTVNNTWTYQNVNFTYYTNNTPDTLMLVATPSANILFGDGSYGYAKIGSQLYVDGIALNFLTSTQQLAVNSNIELYPNPVTNIFTITSNETLSKIEIFDITGKLLRSELLTQNQQINIADFNNGVYLYKIYNNKNQLLKTGKLIKK